MNVKALVFGITADESEPARFLDGLNPAERFRGELHNQLAPFSAALGEDFLGDGIGCQKRTATHQLGRRRIHLRHTSEGQRKRNGH